MEYLDLGSNLIENISLKAFAGLSKLKGLDLHSNRLSTMNYSWFADLIEARQLDLANNQLAFIDAKDLYSLHNLNLLNLSNNYIHTINREAFNSLHDLIILDLSSNDLPSIPTFPLRSCTSLKKAILDRNPVMKIKPNDFSNMSISHLSISFMPKLSVIEKYSFKNLPFLEDLKAHNNPRLIYIDSHAFFRLYLRYIDKTSKYSHTRQLPNQVRHSTIT